MAQTAAFLYLSLFPAPSGIGSYCNPHYSLLKYTFHVNLTQQIRLVRARPIAIVSSIESQKSAA